MATDGSDNAQRAVELGAEIAKRFRAELLLAHVLVDKPSKREITRMGELMHSLGPQPFAPMHMKELVQLVGTVPGSEHVESQREAVHAVGNQILRRARETAQAAGIGQPEAQLLHGEPADTIVDLAKSRQADLLVMGTRGLGALEGTVFGSVSLHITTHAPASCLTVR